MSNIVGGSNVLSKITENPANIIDLLSLYQGSRFAVTFLDFAKRDIAVNDEVLIDKITATLYYKDKEGTIRPVNFGVNVPEDIEGRLISLEEAVIEAVRESKEYVDSIFSEASLGTSFKMVHFHRTIHVTETRSTFKIPLDSYNKDRDLMIVTSNSAFPSPENPTLGYTVDDNNYITFVTEFNPGMEIYFLFLKNVPVGVEDAFDGYYIKDNTIAERKLDEALRKKINEITWEQLSPELREKLENMGGGSGPVTGIIPGNFIVASSQPTNQADKGMWIEVPAPFPEVASNAIEVGDKNKIDAEYGHLVFDTKNK